MKFFLQDPELQVDEPPFRHNRRGTVCGVMLILGRHEQTSDHSRRGNDDVFQYGYKVGAPVGFIRVTYRSGSDSKTPVSPQQPILAWVTVLERWKLREPCMAYRERNGLGNVNWFESLPGRLADLCIFQMVQCISESSRQLGLFESDSVVFIAYITLLGSREGLLKLVSFRDFLRLF